ncbi:serine hydrolase domain-containing protein [Chloroflexota bacterium]
MRAENTDNWPLPFTEPEEVGFSSERLARIRPTLQTYVDNGVVPNLITLVARHGKIVHFEVQGYMDMETKKPVQKDTIYRWWSNTKPITGVATMICVEEGLLNLDDPISKFSPSFKNPVVRTLDPTARRGEGRGGPGMMPSVPANREITIRDCLRNTTGLATASRAPIQYLTEYRNIITDPGWLPNPMKRSEPLKETVEAQAKLPLSFHPGTVFEYHVGFPVIGVVLELVTGKTLDEFFKERIFEPLGMKDSSFYLPDDKLDRFPVCYRPVREDKEWKLTVAERPETSEKVVGPKTYFEAGGGLGGVLGTISDYTRFCQMLLNKGELDGVRLLGRKSVEIMTSSHTAENIYVGPSGPGFGFGMGVGVYKGTTPPVLRSVGTYGWGGAAGTSFFADPKEDLLCVSFTQVLMGIMMPGSTYHDEFERMVYQALI